MWATFSLSSRPCARTAFSPRNRRPSSLGTGGSGRSIFWSDTLMSPSMGLSRRCPCPRSPAHSALPPPCRANAQWPRSDSRRVRRDARPGGGCHRQSDGIPHRAAAVDCRDACRQREQRTAPDRQERTAHRVIHLAGVPVAESRSGAARPRRIRRWCGRSPPPRLVDRHRSPARSGRWHEMPSVQTGQGLTNPAPARLAPARRKVAIAIMSLSLSQPSVRLCQMRKLLSPFDATVCIAFFISTQGRLRIQRECVLSVLSQCG